LVLRNIVKMEDRYDVVNGMFENLVGFARKLRHFSSLDDGKRIDDYVGLIESTKEDIMEIANRAGGQFGNLVQRSLESFLRKSESSGHYIGEVVQ